METPLPAIHAACLSFILTLPRLSAQDKTQSLEFTKPEPANGPVTASFVEESGLSVRVIPKDGLRPGGGAPVRLELNGGAPAALINAGRAVAAKFTGKDQSVKIRAGHGKWDLREAHMVRVKIRNTGANRATPAVHLSSEPGPTDTAIHPIEPGATGEAFVSFISAVP